MCYTMYNNTLGNCAHFFRKRETMTTKDYQTRRPLRIFLSYFRPHRGLFLLDISCAFLIAVIDLAFPLISRTAMYHWLPDKQFSIFFTVMALVVAAFVLRAGLYFIVGYWGHTFGILVEADIRRDLFAHMQDLGFDFYDKNRTGQLMSRLTTDLFELTELAHHGPEDLFISLVTIVGALAVMFSIQWRLALVVCCIIPVFLLVVLYRRRQMSQASRAAKQKTGAINAEIESGLSGVRTTKAFANEAAESARPGVFVLDKFGYCKILEPSIYERNRETVDTENVYVLPCHTTDKIGLFTDLGAFHQVKVTEIPFGKLRDKGVPIDNLSKFDGTKERPVCVVNAAQLKGQKLLFATKDAMIKIVPGGEFETNNRTVAATKLQENDMLLSVQPADGMREAVIQTTSGIFLRFPIEEISEMKKNAKGVRGIKLGRTESLEAIHLLDGTEDDPIVMYKEKPVHLSRLKIGHRDGKGSRARS